MIAKMEQLFLVGPKRLATSVLLKLQQAGVVHLEPVSSELLRAYQLDPEEESLLRRWQEVLFATDHTAGLLGLETDKAMAPFAGNLDEAAAAAASREAQAAALVEKRQRLQDELQVLDQYREPLVYMAEAVQGLDRSRWLAVLPFLAGSADELASLAAALAAKLEDRYLLEAAAVGGGYGAVIITTQKEADTARNLLRHQGLGEFPRFKEYAGLDLKEAAVRMTARSESAPAELADVEAELAGLAQETGPEIQSLRLRALNEASRLGALRGMASGRYGFVLSGWVPVQQKERVLNELAKLVEKIVYAFEPAGDHQAPERIPVKLENAPWVAPFEPLISFLNTPRYDSWDPTWITAVLFPLWFGMVVGDLGYGLIFAGLAWYLARLARRQQALRIDFFKLRLAPEALTKVVGVMKPLIAWTLIFGCMYGEVFGNLFQHLGIFGLPGHPGLIPTLIPRTETRLTANMLILICIGFGAFQVLHGFVLKAKLARARGERRHFWEGCGYFGGVATLILFGYAFMTASYPGWLLIMILASAALFIVGMILARMPLMIAELPTQGGHILSYIRIYAVGLASAVLADLATDIGFSLYQMAGIAGIVVGVVVGLLLGVLVHAILIVLLTISHVLQPIRLIWVEFFTKFDFYTLNGRPYSPFKFQGDSP